MKRTDTGRGFNVLAEGKYRERQEMKSEDIAISGEKPKFAYSEGFENVQMDDGSLLKGIKMVVFFDH